jgi:hypothetical protein
MNKRQRKRKEKQARQQRAEDSVAAASAKKEIGEHKLKTEETNRTEHSADHQGQTPMSYKEWFHHIPNWAMAMFTAVLTIIAAVQACLISNQTDTMKKDQRPWIKMTNIPVSNTMNENTTIIGHLQLINSGKTPAKNVVVKISVQKFAKDHVPNCSYTLPQPNAVFGVLYPNAPTGAVESPPYGVQTKPGEFEPFGLDDMKKFANWDLYYVVCAEATYTDFFHRGHVTHFCEWSAANSPTPREFSARACTEYNSVDDN